MQMQTEKMPTPEVFGVYLNGDPVNVVRESDHTRVVAEKDDRIVALVNLNETKVQTIQDLRAEVERAQASEGTEVQRSAAARAEVEAMKRQAVELANGRDMYKQMHQQVRSDVATWAEEHEIEHEVVNALLTDLGFEPLPEYVEAEVTITATVRFKAGTLAEVPSALEVERNCDFDITVRPAYSSGLEVDEAEVAAADVTSVVAH